SPRARNRELHAAVCRAVLDAYGWTDSEPACEFLLDYEDEDDDEEPDSRRSSRGRRKPWRYRWPDEVLARLLALNAPQRLARRGGASGGRGRRGRVEAEKAREQEEAGEDETLAGDRNVLGSARRHDDPTPLVGVVKQMACYNCCQGR